MLTSHKTGMMLREVLKSSNVLLGWTCRMLAAWFWAKRAATRVGSLRCMILACCSGLHRRRTSRCWRSESSCLVPGQMPRKLGSLDRILAHPLVPARRAWDKSGRTRLLLLQVEADSMRSRGCGYLPANGHRVPSQSQTQARLLKVV